MLKVKQAFRVGLWGTVGNQLVCPGPEQSDEAFVHVLAFQDASRQSPAFVFS